jgi:PncC family amidohydrolase
MVLVAEIAALSLVRGRTIAVAESVTAGHLSALLCTGEQAAQWFQGGIVAYSAHAKQILLGVPEGPLITRDCAQRMARAIAEQLGADLAIATTGVGGPDYVEGHPPGTVWIGYTSNGTSAAQCRRYNGAPKEVVASAVLDALTILRQLLGAETSRSAP